MTEINIGANAEKWEFLRESIKQTLLIFDLPKSDINRAIIICEEIYINVSKYAYPGGNGDIKIVINYSKSDKILILKFTDSGIPFDPTKIPYVDIHEPLKTRKFGGLGLHIVREAASSMNYERLKNKNMLTIKIK